MHMRRMSIARVIVAASAAALLLWVASARLSGQARAGSVDIPASIDKVFEKWDRTGSPGCAVGVSERGDVVHMRGYGMANLEYGVRIRPDTLFESGSVAKQFTAAAIVLLSIDGKLSIDDPVRKYIPELPDFGTPILIRHFLNHTSGLRSQWPMLTIAGRPPGQAVHTIDEILELVSGYKELNFKPGDEYLYNNTAFTLLSVIVQRVSGKPFAEFCRERLFKPLGMTHTQWRDDFTKIVEKRATAYRSLPNGEFRTNMPFTNVIGNGGLLSTVGDFLIWNENLDNPRVGGKAMVDELQTRGRLNDGFLNEYAEGLIITDYRGVREVSHGGSTAGYQTFLARWPEKRLSVVVLCNTTGTNPGGYAHQVAELFLSDALKDRPVAKRIDVPEAELQKLAGLYREKQTDAVMRIAYDANAKVLRSGGATLVPTAPNVFATQDASRTFSVEAGPAGATKVTETDGRSRPRVWQLEPPFAPTPAQLAAYAGDYVCDELGGLVYTFYVDGTALKARARPAQRFTLTPVFTDGFTGDGNTVRFTRDAKGLVEGLRIYAGRVWHLRFAKKAGAAAGRAGE
jgi:CubicO group peptidase (beta-lactamase class C family)